MASTTPTTDGASRAKGKGNNRGARKSGHNSSVRKEPVSSDLILKPGQDLNVLPWKNKMICDAGINYGLLSTLMEKYEYYAPDEILIDDFQRDGAYFDDSRDDFREAKKNRNKIMARLKDNHPIV